ncbi:hypothetical protein H4R35_006617 [Dimargaris xerosporica]|nr:hypothetical protein H4R35_006617 [Dimargaris xerosporica]
MTVQYAANYFTPDILAERLGDLFVSSHHYPNLTTPSPDSALSLDAPDSSLASPSPPPQPPTARRRRNGMCDLDNSIRDFFAAGQC